MGLSLALAIVGCGEKAEPTAPLSVIMETDIGNDIDDALAMDMLYKYIDAGKINLLAVNINKEGIYPDGKPAFARSLTGKYESLPDAVQLYRKILSRQPDASVTIVSVGFSTNLVRLMDSQPDSLSPLPGMELISKKVRLLVTMAGDFTRPDAKEYNVITDIPAAKKLFSEWPTPLVTSPFDVGSAIRYPATSIENDFGWTTLHPVVEAYKAYLKMPYDRQTWDLTAVLYAVEGASWFTVSPAGKIEVTDEGNTHFTQDKKLFSKTYT